MSYESIISFTLDTICPFTYLAKRRLDAALSQVRALNPPVNFTVYYWPYQLFDDAPSTGEDKYEWYLREKYNGSEEQMKKYITLMTAYGAPDGIDFKFGGTIASTLDAHRVIQHFQKDRGPQVADKLIASLYGQYFEQEQHPSSRNTLLKACVDAGIPESEAASFIDSPGDGLQEVKMQIREQAGNGVDAVPFIVIEGKRRDITLEGAKDVAEYVKALEQIIKEAS